MAEQNRRAPRLNLFLELKRRNVIRVAIGYAVLAWLVAQVADLFLEAFGAPDWALKSLLVLLVLGFPIAVFFAWAFELTPEGLKRENQVDRSRSITHQTGRKLDRAIIGILVVALAYFVWDKFGARPVQSPTMDPPAAISAAPGEVSTESALPKDKSIAVLPFENRSRQEQDEYFTSGIHDDLLTQLAQIGSLRVISRTSVAQFKNTTLSIREIAETLGVATILEGGVQRAGNQVRINMQLIDAETDAHLWAQTYDRELTANNVFAIQSEIAGAVTNAMRVTLTPDEQQRMRETPTENMAALELHFKGRAELDERTLPAIESARLLFEEARRLDPGFALAWAGEAQAILLLSDSPNSYGEIPRLEANDMARRLLEQAYAVAPDDPQVLGVYGLLEQSAFDSGQALDYYRRSLQANPSSGEVLNWQRMAQAGAGLRRQSLQTAARMVVVDPLSKIALFNAAATFVNTPYDDGIQVERLLDRLEGLDKSYGLSARATVYESRGQIVEAIRHFYRSIELNPGRSSALSDLAGLLMGLGLVDEAMKVDSQRDQFDEATARWDRVRLLRLAREAFQENPESLQARFRLVYSIVYAADTPEEAMPIVLDIWRALADAPGALGFFALDFAWIANLAEYPAEAQRLRDLGAEDLQKRLEVGEADVYVESQKAKLALLDGRTDDAVQALGRSIDLGERDRFLAENMFYVTLRDDPRFQALASRMRDTIERERAEVVAMLCGPDKIVSVYQPAAETCALYPGP
jgi:TolB-like protein